MYYVLTNAYASAAQVDQASLRNTSLLGFRVVPLLQAGQTYAEALAGLRFTYFFNSQWAQGAPGHGASFQGNSSLAVFDGSTQMLVNAANLFITGAPAGQRYFITFLEMPGEELLPDDAAAAAGEGGGGGGNNPALVATTNELIAFGTSPVPGNGASIAGAKGVRLYAILDGAGFANPIPATAAFLCWRINASAGVYVRVPDLDIPVNASAAGLQAIGFPDQSFETGTAGEKIIWVPNAACGGAGATQAALTIEVQS